MVHPGNKDSWRCFFSNKQHQVEVDMSVFNKENFLHEPSTMKIFALKRSKEWG